jgi:two-component system sensor histidine kinase DegS
VQETVLDERVARAPDSVAEPAGLEAIRTSLGDELLKLGRELDEISMLAQQAGIEAERHETRRVRNDERIGSLEREPRVDANELREARAQQLLLTRRATLFEAQQQVLEGKQRTLVRYRDRVAQLDAQLATLDSGSASGPDGPVPMARPRESPERGALLRAKEDLRREIARQMHDGPAQSLANIALQAEIVQRMVVRGDQRVQAELEALRTMVQHALDATKAFIFDVRPMVLDDLGLVPTLRRIAIDRSSRSGIEVEFTSHGHERRFAAELESALFRIVDDLMAGYIALRPHRLVVALDWGDRELGVRLRGSWPASSAVRAGVPQPHDGPVRDDLPPALRQMIEETRSDAQTARVAARALAPELVGDIQGRIRDIGGSLARSDDGSGMELSVTIAR